MSHSDATIHRISLNSHFSILPNSAAEDPRLSWSAKGLLWYILSRPKDWVIKTWQLAQIYQGDRNGNKKDAITSILEELKQTGYVKYIKSRDSKGRWVHRYDVYPMPYETFQKMFPEPEVPVVDSPLMETPAITTSTELPSTEIPIVVDARVVVEKPSVVYDPSKEDDPEEEPMQSITYTTTNGTQKKITETEIYRHFLREPYSTETVKKAIKRMKASANPINDPIKYLLGICGNIEKLKKHPTEKKVEAEKPETEYTEAPKKPEQRVSFADYWKKNDAEPPIRNPLH